MKISKLTKIITIAALLTGCASQPREPEDAVTRAQQRWDLLIAGDYVGAYEYLTPGYRSTVSAEQYDARLRTRTVKWLAAQAHEADCEAGDVCSVTVTLDFEVVMPVFGIGKQRSFQPLKEKWLLDDGAWYFLPKE